MFSLLIVYLMTPIFLIILIFGERRLKSCSFVVFVSCALNLLTDSKYDLFLTPSELETDFILNVRISILWDSACALLLITSKLFNQDSGKQALLLAFAVLCHIMVAYGLSSFFRAWYVELIILIGMVQIWVVWHGLGAAFNELRRFISRPIYYFSRSSKSLLELEEVD